MGDDGCTFHVQPTAGSRLWNLSHPTRSTARFRVGCALKVRLAAREGEVGVDEAEEAEAAPEADKAEAAPEAAPEANNWADVTVGAIFRHEVVFQRNRRRKLAQALMRREDERCP